MGSVWMIFYTVLAACLGLVVFNVYALTFMVLETPSTTSEPAKVELEEAADLSPAYLMQELETLKGSIADDIRDITSIIEM